MADRAAVILRETMIEAGKAFLSRVPVEVEVTIGETWAEKQGPFRLQERTALN
jgi:DNA polymerase I-like protein with 3'-5' exonuclease and polymerase domains